MRLDVTNMGDYLLTIREAALLLRMSRVKFVNNYIKTNKIAVTLLEDGRKMIRRIHINEYLDTQKYHYAEPVKQRKVTYGKS